MKDMTYQQRAAYVMGLYPGWLHRQEELAGFAERAYGPDKFDTSAVAPSAQSGRRHLLPGAVARPHLRL